MAAPQKRSSRKVRGKSRFIDVARNDFESYLSTMKQENVFPFSVIAFVVGGGMALLLAAYQGQFTEKADDQPVAVSTYE